MASCSTAFGDHHFRKEFQARNISKSYDLAQEQRKAVAFPIQTWSDWFYVSELPYLP
jgi:hypothetical protein